MMWCYYFDSSFLWQLRQKLKQQTIHPSIITSIIFIFLHIRILKVCSFTVDGSFKTASTYSRSYALNYAFRNDTLSIYEKTASSSTVAFNEHYNKVPFDVTYRRNLQIQRILEDSKCFNNDFPSDRAVLEVEKILLDLEKQNQADTITYNLVIHAFARSNIHDKAQRAQKILRRMENIYHHEMPKNNMTLPPNSKLSSQQIDDAQPALNIKPNVRTYSSVIDAFAKSSTMDRTDAAESAQQILERLRHMYDATGAPDLKPNTILYNTVINCWAKTESLHGAQMAMKLLEYMESYQSDCVPDVITYNTCIHAWAKCGAKESGERAESILRRMTESFNQEACKPNIRTYSCCIDAWCCSGSPSAARRAHALLDELETIYNQTGDPSMQPNAFTYASIINAYARSKQSEKKAASALQILKHMKDIYDSGKNPLAKPTIVTYNSVLNACATTFGGLGRSKDDRQLGQQLMIRSKSLALGIVRVIYREVTSENSDVSPDHFTYGTVLKACANLMSPIDDEAFIRQIFEKCCEDGQVSFGVLFQLRQAASAELYRDLIPSEAVDRSNNHFILEKLPTSWSRNVNNRRSDHSKD